MLPKITERDCPGNPLFKTSPSIAGDAGSIPGQGGKIPHALWLKKKKKKKIKQNFLVADMQ